MSAALLDAIRGKRALVLGDLMLDEYIFGSATRISPEAPVMVVRQTRTDHVPGGAANVARNIVALGGEARLAGVVGPDEAAERLGRSLASEGIDPAGLVADPARATTRKTRIVADHAHQVLRIDHEEDGPLEPAVAQRLIERVELGLADADVLVLSDYLKGALTATVAQRAIELARARGVPVVVNPKPRSLEQYVGATLVSLNRAEVSEALGLWRALRDEDAAEAGAALRAKLGVEAVLVTLGESGMHASGPEEISIAAPRVEVYDTAGAGDTVVATVALGYAAYGYAREVFELAAQTAACVVSHVGVATPTPADLERLRAH